MGRSVSRTQAEGTPLLVECGGLVASVTSGPLTDVSASVLYSHTMGVKEERALVGQTPKSAALEECDWAIGLVTWA